MVAVSRCVVLCCVVAAHKELCSFFFVPDENVLFAFSLVLMHLVSFCALFCSHSDFSRQLR